MSTRPCPCRSRTAGTAKAQWQAEVDKMRTAYKAPIGPKDVDGILDYLVSVKGEK